MLTAAVKQGISRALSTHPGFEVWDFDMREDQTSEGKTTLSIRYRYHPGLLLVATVSPRATHGGTPDYDIGVEVVPGSMRHKESFAVAGRKDLFDAIERWAGRIEEELFARPINRVLEAQQKALHFLQQHLLELPDQRMSAEHIRDYRARLDRLESAVIELRAGEGGDGEYRDARTVEIRDEFECLRQRVEILGERSFFHAVLVRLVKYFWDDENLRIVEAGSRAAQEFLGDPDEPKRQPVKSVSAPRVS